MNEFLNMGGYAGYVWPAYGVTFAVFIVLIAMIWSRSEALRARLERQNNQKTGAGAE